MKTLLSKGSIAKIALLMLLLLNAFVGMSVLVNAAATKDANVLITGSGSVELVWKSKKSENCSSTDYAEYYVSLGGLSYLTIIPTHGWHIAVVVIDERLVGILDEDGFSLSDGLPKREVSVTFEANPGVDDVATGFNVPAYPDPGVGLIFVHVETGGWAYAYAIELQEPSPLGDFWHVYTDAVFDPGVTVILVLNLEDVERVIGDPENVRLFKTDSVLLVRSDVTWDGVVNGDDISDVGNANPSAEGDPDWDPKYDLNDDRVVDDLDVNIVNDFNGESVWEDITFRVDVDYDNGLVYVLGVTDDLCVLWSR